MAGERLLPGLGLTGFWDSGSPYKTEMDTNLLRLSVLVQGAVIDSVAVVPGAPVDGNVYLATAAWGSGAADDIMAYDAGAWVPFTPSAGWRFYDVAAGVFKEFNGATWVVSGSSGSSWYDLRIGFTATPGTDEVIDTIVAVRDITLPADLAGSAGIVGTNATAAYDVTVKDDGVDIATITFNTDGSFTFATTGGTAKVIASGSIIQFVGATTPDASVSDASVTIAGVA